jgi:hypothetical protein
MEGSFKASVGTHKRSAGVPETSPDSIGAGDGLGNPSSVPTESSNSQFLFTFTACSTNLCRAALRRGHPSASSAA